MRMTSRLSRMLSPRRLAALALGALIGLGGLQASASAATYTAADSAALQGYLDNPSVVLGDTIILNAGSTYTGQFTLRAKSGTGYLTIQSSAMASLPAAGVRVKPSHAGSMPNIVSPGSNVPAIRTAIPPEIPHHYKLIGLEVYNGGTQAELSNLIILGDYSAAQNSPSVIAHNIILDRCYIHGDQMAPGTKQLRRAIMLQSNSTDIINCTISDVLSNAGQTACIGGWNGGGPYLIDNNFLSGSGENIIFGGNSGTVVGQNPTGITVSRNHFYKDPAWKNVWTRICNHFELKHGKDVIIRDNLMEYCWNNPSDSQFGTSIGLKTVQGTGSAGSSWYVTENVLIENNLIHDVGLGFYIAGSVSPTGAKLYGQPANVTIRNNLAYNIDTSFTGNRGWLFYMQNSSPNVTIDHNTGFQTHMSMNAGDSDVKSHKYTGFVYTNNMTMKSQYGFTGGASSDGELTLNDFFVTPTYQKNVTMGSTLSAYDNVIGGITVGPPWYAGWDQAPFNNANLLRPTSWTGVLQNQASPGTDYSGFKVVGWNQPTNFATYPYNNSGTDGKDIGCDIDQLNTKIAGCISGTWGGPPPTPIASESFNYTVPGGLNGKTGGTGFGSNAWTAVSGQTDPALASGSLTYASGSDSIITAGNKAAPVNTSRSVRNFSSTIATASTTKWASFRIKRAPGTFPSNHAGFSLFSGTLGSGNEIFIGKPASATNWGIFHSGSNTTSIATGTVQYDAFLLCKMVFTSTTVTIQLWVNPPLVEGSLGSPLATISNVAHSTGFGSLRLSTGTNSTGYEFDEFRLGDTFIAVTD